MNDPISLDANYFVAPQVLEADLAQVKALGFERVINNRPDNESEDQPASAELKKAVEVLGLEYVENPVDLKVLSEKEVSTQAAAVSEQKKTLAFCRTGTRSSVLWVLMNNAQGGSYDALKAEVSAKGFDLARCEGAMAPLAK